MVNSQNNTNLPIYPSNKEKNGANSDLMPKTALIIDDPTDYEIEKINSDDESIMLIGTLDGFIHAFDSNNNSEKWKINLGNPLVMSHINTEKLGDKQLLFPGPDGHLYYTNHLDDSFQKLDVSLKNLIEKSPYTLPNMPNTLFIGNKNTRVFIIDITTGTIVSKISEDNNERREDIKDEEFLHKRPTRSNNLATIIRIDHTLKSIDRETGEQLWNVTTSEIMVIEKGAKHELSYNTGIEKSNKNPQFKENLLTFQMKRHFNNSNLNSIVNVYKFTKDAPFKIFDNNNTVTNNFNDYINERLPSHGEKSVFELFQEFYKWKKGKMNDFTLEQLMKEIYSQDKLKKFGNAKHIVALLCVLIISFYIIYLISNNQKRPKSESINVNISSQLNGDANSNSTSGTSKELNDNLNQDEPITSLVKLPGYCEKRNFTGEYYEEAKMLPNNENAGTIINDIFQNLCEKPDIDYKYDEKNNQVHIIEKSSVILSKKDYNLEGFLQETVKVNKGAEAVSKKVNFEVEEKDDKYILDRNLVTTYKQKDSSFDIIPGNCLPCSNSKTSSLNNIKTSNPSKLRASSIDAGIAKSYKEDEEGYSIDDCDSRSPKKKHRSCSPHQKKTPIVKIQKIPEKTDNDLRYTSDVSSDYQLNIMEDDTNFFPKKYEKISHKLSTENLLALNSNRSSFKESKLIKANLGQNNLISQVQDESISKIYFKNEDETALPPKKTSNKNISPKAQEISNMISFESISNINMNSRNKTLIKHSEHSNKNEKSLVHHSKFGNDESQVDFYTIKSPYSKVLRDNIDRLDNGRFKKDFSIYDILGEGGFGCVHKVKHRLDGSYYAVKVVELEVGLNEYLKDLSVLKEVKTMLKLQHKNVVRYFNCWFESKNNSIEIEKKKMSHKKSIKSRGHKLAQSNISETVEVISKQSVNSSALGIKFEKDRTVIEEIKEASVIKEEEEPQEIFSESDEEKQKGFSIDYEKNSSKDEEGKNYSIDDSKLLSKKEKQNESTFKILFYMQMEYCGNETLQAFLQKREKNLDRKTIFFLFKQIALGVAHIHKNGIIHRDLKPANIFMTGGSKINIKIGDFGLATDVVESKKSRSEVAKNGAFPSMTSLSKEEFSVKLSENVGTPLYQSPEQIRNLLYNEKVDIYSLGLVLLEICSFFKTYHERKLCLENVREFSIIPDKIKESYPIESELILQMTAASPSSRPSAQNLLKSEAFKKLEQEFEAFNKK